MLVWKGVDDSNFPAGAQVRVVDAESRRKTGRGPKKKREAMASRLR